MIIDSFYKQECCDSRGHLPEKGFAILARDLVIGSPDLHRLALTSSQQTSIGNLQDPKKHLKLEVVR
jgi:hypothetical protein